MTRYPVILLPKGEIMVTAKVEGSEIKLLKKTLFPSGKRYAISDNGLAACLDKDKKLILFGQLNEDGDFEDLKILPFPSVTSPKSISIVRNNIVLGGENKSDFVKSYELVVAYSIREDKFIMVDMPFKGFDKCVDDLLIDGNKVLAVDNIVYPKYLIEYDFSNPDYPHLVKSFSLPENGTYESIKKGTLNEEYLALLSSSFGMDGGGRYINIFIKGDYENYIRLSQWYGLTNENEKQKKRYSWSDIYLVPGANTLLISADEDGIGLYYIGDELMDQNGFDDSESVLYFNSWNKKIIKLLPVPNDNDSLVIVFEETSSQNVAYSYVVESIANILLSYSRDDDFESKAPIYYQDNAVDDQDNDYERDYFDAMTDGQLGDYDDFIERGGDIDDIDTWARG